MDSAATFVDAEVNGNVAVSDFRQTLGPAPKTMFLVFVAVFLIRIPGCLFPKSLDVFLVLLLEENIFMISQLCNNCNRFLLSFFF
jgi:hypothetical protein